MPFTSIATITGRVSTGADGLCWRQPYQFNHVLQIYYVFDLCDFTLFLLLHVFSTSIWGYYVEGQEELHPFEDHLLALKTGTPILEPF